LALLERYQSAMQARDAEAVLALCSVDYRDSMGTSERSDDLDLEGLRAKLKQRLSAISSLRLDLEVIKLRFQDASDPKKGSKEDFATIELRYDLRFQMEVAGRSKWLNEMDLSRMILRKESAGWRVLSGL